MVYKVIRRAANQWAMDDSADNPSRPYGEPVVLEQGGLHDDMMAAAVEMDARNCLLAETESDRWSIEADHLSADELADEMAVIDIEADQVADWLEAHGEDRRLAD